MLSSVKMSATEKGRLKRSHVFFQAAPRPCPRVINIKFMSNSWKMSAQVAGKVLETQFNAARAGI